jgi:aldose sugar dehydrogenase
MLALVFIGALACGSRDAESRDASIGASASGARVLAVGDSVTYEAVASGLEVPWAVALLPDGRMLVTERRGRVRTVRDGKVETSPWATVPVAAVGEAGLLGLAVGKDFSTTRHVYLCGTFRVGNRLVDRVFRYTDSSGVGTDPTLIVDDIPAAEFHAGNTISLGEDGMLYIATGDARNPGQAQDPHSLAGKILRYTLVGRIPPDNPARGSPVFASGLRNVQGLAWSRVAGLVATDHGPSGFPNERFRRNNDELNAIRAGKNYGWPSVVGDAHRTAFVDPIVTWNPGIAPSGVAAYTGPVAALRDQLFVGALGGEHLRRVVIAANADHNGWRVTREEALFPELGRIRAVTMASDGFLYFTTSNRDGRGTPRRDDDHVYRLRPRQP